ncbi:MAG: MFS transporter [Pseudomonadota bacterium]
MAITAKQRVWGWMSFDWATQPYYTLGLTFIFGPYFAVVAASYYAGQGLEGDAANAQAQSTWALGQTLAGLVIAFTAPFLGAFADNTGRKRPWLFFFSILYIVGAWSLWFMTPDSSSLMLFLVIFYIAFIAAESALNFINAYLPSLGTEDEVGKISGSGAAFGYAGGLVSLILMLIFLAEDANTGKTLIGLDPLFGLDASAREGTRAVGPLIAIWYLIFMVPFFLWVHDDPEDKGSVPPMSKVWGDLKETLKKVWNRPSTRNFLIGGMFYRDALNALYAFGGVYATLVLGWETLWLGVFGIISVISAAIFTWIGGRFDAKVGPKPVIIFCILMLLVVSSIIVGMSRTQIFGVPMPEGAILPDIIFFICGCIIGAAGGALYAASRSLMVRHTDPERPTEAFGLFALSGKATAFLAPMLIGLFTAITGNVQLGFLPVIILFLLGLVMLRWVNKDGDRAVWSAS